MITNEPIIILLCCSVIGSFSLILLGIIHILGIINAFAARDCLFPAVSMILITFISSISSTFVASPMLHATRTISS